MVSLTETTTIPSPADEVWPLLSDPALVASCIPGATLAPDQGDGLWRGSIRVKFGPTVAVFRGEASLAFDHAARTCTIEGRGIDGRGASRALASGVVKVSGSRRDRARRRRQLHGQRAAGDLRQCRRRPCGARPAGGVLRQHGEAGGRARDRPRRRAAGTGRDCRAAIAAAAAATGAAELSGVRLLWRAFLSWLRSLFGKREKSMSSKLKVSDMLAQAFAAEGVEHAVHPDGRRQHVLVGGDGRSCPA